MNNSSNTFLQNDLQEAECTVVSLWRLSLAFYAKLTSTAYLKTAEYKGTKPNLYLSVPLIKHRRKIRIHWMKWIFSLLFWFTGCDLEFHRECSSWEHILTTIYTRAFLREVK